LGIGIVKDISLLIQTTLIINANNEVNNIPVEEGMGKHILIGVRRSKNENNLAQRRVRITN
jgi:hypothetical protein